MPDIDEIEAAFPPGLEEFEKDKGQSYHDKADPLADRHVDWLLDKVVMPIAKLIGKEEFAHGYKHGQEDAQPRIKELEAEVTRLNRELKERREDFMKALEEKDG